MFWRKKSVLFILLFIFGMALPSGSKTLKEKRQYEPVILPAQKIAGFYGIPVDEIFLYAYHQDSLSWEMMPFQIDERTAGLDPLNQSDSIAFYFIPDEWDIDHHNGVLSLYDELVFMIRDLGDKAPPKSWIENEEAKTNPRLEIIITDPDDANNRLYGYLFRSPTITEEVPTPYNMEAFPEQDGLSTAYYSVDIGEYGLIEDITIKPPGGNGLDIFDTQKFRFKGFIDLFIPIELNMTEEQLYLYHDSTKYTARPVVRMIRQAIQTLQIGSFRSDDTPFYVVSKFYPFSGSIVGGTSISSDDLKKYFNGADIIIKMENLRQSWDFNENAKGMVFYNKYNNGIPIDGIPDKVNTQIDLPIREWNLNTGVQGSFFTYTTFTETKWQDVKLYFCDDLFPNKPPCDSGIFGNYETGDSGHVKLSFGDQGISFGNYGEDDITLELSFTAYFLPEKNLPKSTGKQLANNIENLVHISSSLMTDVAGEPVQQSPFTYQLRQNRPNPVTGATDVIFSLPGYEPVKIEIRDLNGRYIATITNRAFAAGWHQVRWNGADENGRAVASGIYFLTMKTKQFYTARKVMVLR
ncbi:MAG TPA: T9SS type A sorting domain-containing protein [Bacteroidetes bacterium]|nr:T9SS type A sorting domain-containing protein [Bacteroidota bacterium]